MSKNIARLAVTAGLTAALSFGGVMAPVTMAFADDGGNSITITQSEGNASTTFKAYQIFKADVVDPTEEGTADKIVSNVKWADDVEPSVQNAIIAAIEADSKYETSNPKLPNKATAQDVADWLTKNVTGTNAETAVNKDHLLNKIAGIVKSGVTATGSSFLAGNSFTVPNDENNSPKTGYYLFLTDESSLSTSEAAKKNTGTSPIFAVVGGSSVTVAEKTSIPTVNKEVREGATWGKVSDSYIGEELEYKLTGSVASNIDTFTKYEYTFQDHLSVGLEAIKSSVEVKINGQVIQPANGYTVDLVDTKNASGNLTGGQDLTISFSNLKDAAAAAGVTLGGDSKVVVTYKAKLTDKAEYTATGNTNDVKLVYSNNPMVEGTGTSTPERVTDHVFRLDVTKVEKDNQNQKLEATFQVKMTKEGDTSLKTNRWLTQTGGITENEKDAGKFKTDKETGKIYIPGLVEGTYEITECNTPAGYNTLAPFTITVKPKYNADGSLQSLDVTSSNTEMVTSSATNDATIPVTIQNKKGSGLPLTGLNGVTFTWIAGGAVLCIGVAHLIRSRKQAEESEQE
ncbi:isopeptide-forming domain-containing fimbrial protein [Collinsella aerofaciens]|uniref:Isopeptide-forming domain-containing fimbrial protein n=1 Tax=Collinsella aerofaciens TaxID=74426 RepID=A0A6L8RI82_9ACTN|nr:isopeptide-forming domain-containing fimbrial protein [Collinsella aerofaciens]MZJ68214.1 isopeptide-forming domain-containing fimbrial protein [Collinsella aerofaciens]MZJ85464.1 isopeptide-forming domain-containing fimbrial protein [Collinsella aerofaciens]